MRSYSAIYVDAGYLIAASATRVTGTSLRSGTTIDHGQLVEGLIAQAEQASGLPVLRVNWYDSASRGPTEEQRRIAMLPRVKVRLGRLSYSGEQKGVDLRIGLDLTTQGRRRVVDVAYLVSGDDDLTEAVEEAQSHGVQVFLLAVGGADGQPHGVAHHLLSESDGLIVIDPSTISAAVRPADVTPAPPQPIPVVVPHSVPSPADVAKRHGDPVRAAGVVTPNVMAHGAPAAAPAGVIAGSSLAYSTATGQGARGDGITALDDRVRQLIAEVCRGVVATWVRTAEPGERTQMLKARPSIPRDLDRALLTDLSDRLQTYDLDDAIRYELRATFWAELDADADAAAGPDR